MWIGRPEVQCLGGQQGGSIRGMTRIKPLNAGTVNCSMVDNPRSFKLKSGFIP